MSALIISLALGMIFARFAQIISWLIGAILISLTITTAILMNSINIYSLALALSCVFAYNIGIMIIITHSLFSKETQQ